MGTLSIRKKSPSPPWAHLEIIDGLVSEIFNLLEISKDTKALSLCMPLKNLNILTYCQKRTI